jgi:arsenate reductase
MNSDKPKVAFVCIGNACRSQMAEGFARTYGGDVMEPYSAGMFPAVAVPVETRRIMAEKNIDLSDHFPKPFRLYPTNYFDLVVNMSGLPVEGHNRVREWTVDDPYGMNDRKYRAVRDEIEQLVMALVLELRRGRQSRAG